MSHSFVHLRAHSSYSILQGAINVSQLVKQCITKDMPAIALTDTGNLFGALEFSITACKNGIQPIIGSILKFDPGEQYRVFGKHSNYDEVLLLAKNKLGYQNLLKLASNYYLNNTNGNEHITFTQLAELSEGLILLTSGIKGTIGRLILANRNKDAEKFLLKLNDLFKDHLYIELMRHGLEEEATTEHKFIELGLKHNIPFVASNDIYFIAPEIHKAHEVLLCIADGKYIHEEDRHRSSPHNYFKSAQEMQKLFSDIPEAIENSLIIARRCSVMAEERPTAFPKYETSRAKTAAEELRILTEEGLRNRLKETYKDDNKLSKEQETIYFDRLNYELEVIIKMNFASYLLIVADFVIWSKKNNIPVGPGRGSAAGSIVSWCLRITDPDPVKFGLLFERFLNPERVSLPDVDIDFCQDRRDEVIDYVRNKYGEKRVAHIITFGKLQARAVIRDVGRVLQLPYSTVDRIAKLIPFHAISPVTLSQAIEMEPELKRIQSQNETIADLLDISLKLEGLYRNTSTHAGGIVIADQDLLNLVPLYKDDKSDMLVIQYSMKYAEAAGLIKFDFLGLRTLTMISNAEQLIKLYNKDFNINHVAFNNQKTFDMLSRGLSTGVFQIESGKMQSALSKMKPDSIEDIIALGALNRPGPMNSIADYIDCKHGHAMPDYLHPKLEKILKRTFGVLIYQEQVIETAQILAGYTVAAGDLLRRAMGKKIKSEMDAQREIFIKGAVERDVEKEQANHIFHLIEKFAGYGFNRSHAVAYGIISYHTAFLKANYPHEFFVSIMNTELNDTDKINIFIQEIKNFDIKLTAPDVNQSEAIFSIQKEGNEKVIVYGLGAIRNISIHAMETLSNERRKNGLYKNIFDFIARSDPKIANKRQLEYLIKAGAFDSIHNNRKQLFDSIDILINYNNLKRSIGLSSSQMDLFKKEEIRDEPNLTKTEDWTNDNKLNFECDSFGFYMFSHPLDIYKNYLDQANIFCASHINNNLTQGISQIQIAAIPVQVKAKLSQKGKYMLTVMSTITGIVNVAIFDEVLLERTRDLIYSKVPLILDVTVIKEGEIARVIVKNIYDFKKYLNERRSTITFTIKNEQEMIHTKNLLDISDNVDSSSFVKIILNVEKNNKRIKIELPENTSCDMSKINPKQLHTNSISIKT
ncbi:MAG: DNA polymerase III subunit alpha [Rickettsiales bacterium]|nr:DNA polymerase III subunit alpha [Rickettsiales bacterium]